MLVLLQISKVAPYLGASAAKNKRPENYESER